MVGRFILSDIYKNIKYKIKYKLFTNTYALCLKNDTRHVPVIQRHTCSKRFIPTTILIQIKHPVVWVVCGDGWVGR